MHGHSHKRLVSMMVSLNTYTLKCDDDAAAASAATINWEEVGCQKRSWYTNHVHTPDQTFRLYKV